LWDTARPRLRELLELGWIDQMPKLACIQPHARAPIAEAFRFDRRVLKLVDASVIGKNDSIVRELANTGFKSHIEYAEMTQDGSEFGFIAARS